MRDILWFGLVLLLSGVACYIWIFWREASSTVAAPVPRVIRADARGPALTLDGVPLGATRDAVILRLGQPGLAEGGTELLFRNGSFDVYFDTRGRVTCVAFGQHLRQDGKLLLSVGDPAGRIESSLGKPDRERPSPFGRASFFDEFHLRVYTREPTLSECLDLSKLLDGRAALRPTIRGMVLGGPYFDS